MQGGGGQPDDKGGVAKNARVRVRDGGKGGRDRGGNEEGKFFGDTEDRGTQSRDGWGERKPAEGPDIKEEKYSGEGGHGALDEECGGEKKEGNQIGDRPGPARVHGTENPEPGEYRQKGKKTGENILPFGQPGDGFDAERVHGPEGGTEEGEPLVFTETGEKNSQKSCIGGVEEDVGQMKPPRRVGGGVEEQGIQCKGTPKKRGIHGFVKAAEGRMKRIGGKWRRNHGLGCEIKVVVQFNDSITDGGGEEGKGQEKEENGDN